MNSKLGYYKVADQIFHNKLQAILYANPTKADVTWHFNDEILDKVNWLQEPEPTVDHFYAARAKQIRENFDYVILMLSGGADSTNMLRSFLNNNLHVDEIIAGAPLSGLKNWTADITDKSANNTIAETTLAQFPLLNDIAQSHPTIKITLHDYFEEILEMKTDAWIYESSAHWIHYSGSTRHSLEKFTHIRNMAEAGKRIAVLYGIDKPIICRSETGNLYTVIMDPVVNVVTPHFKDKYPNVESVLFYYTPDLPEMMVKQAHDVCKWVYQPENSWVKDVMWDRSKPMEFNANVARGGNWQRYIIPCIYPAIATSRAAVWQAQKQGTGFRGGFQIDHWIHRLHSGSRIVQMVESDLLLFIKKIDMKYILTEDKADGFIRFYKYWRIGHESDFLPGIPSNINNTDISKTNLEKI